jgi:uncharacterized membrane protein YtjA (UPF0391 family)
MLCWVFVFLGTAIVASLRGLGGLASTAAAIAQMLFLVLLLIFLIALVMGVGRHRPQRTPEDATGDPADAPGDHIVLPAAVSIRRGPLGADNDRGEGPRHAA